MWRIFARRSRSNWRLMSVLGFGVIVAATLLASAPIYARAMSDLGLASRIRNDLMRETPGEQPASPDGNLVTFMQVDVPDIAAASDDGQLFLDAIRRRIDERVGWIRAKQAEYTRGGHFAIPLEGVPADRFPLGQLQALPGYESRVRVVEGRLPQAGSPIEVVLSQRAFRVSGLKVGEEFVFAEDFDTCERQIPVMDAPPPPPCTPKATVRYSFPARLVGVLEPLNSDDPFWGYSSDPYFEPTRNIPDAGPLLPMFVQEEALAAFMRAHPGYGVAITWRLWTDPDRLSAGDFKRAGADARAVFYDFSPYKVWASSPLTSTLQKFERSSDYQQVPLTVLLLEIAGVALFYVVIVATVVVDRQAAEIALLRSRGATALQVTAVYLFDGLVVGALAVAAAPFLAGACIALLGLTPIFDGLGEAALLPVTLTPAAFALAAAGAGLSLLALLGPAFIVSRRSAVTQRRAEARPGASIIQRYFLDLALAGVAGLMLLELSERGSVFTPSATGGVSSDPLLLASPALTIAAGAALMLRFYPLVIRLATRALSAIAGATLAMALWQLARNPGQHTRLALLLMMAVAVGTFAASYSTTADRSFRDRASYQAGVEWRSVAQPPGSYGTDADEADAELLKLPGVAGASAVFRTSGTLATPGQSRTSLQVLSIGPRSAREMLWFRDDFADSSLEGLMAELSLAGELRGKPLPGDPSALGVWLYTAEARDQTTLWARVRDSRNVYGLIELGTLDGRGWRELRGVLHSPSTVELTAPLSLVALVVTQPLNRPQLSSAPAYFDDITAYAADGQAVAVEAFEGASQWAARPVAAARQDEVGLSTEQAHSGRNALKVTLLSGFSGGDRGLYPKDPSVPLPVVASESFAAATGIGVGATGLIEVRGVIVPVTVRATFRLFPTLSTDEGPSVIFDRRSLAAWMNAWVTFDPVRYNEAWFSLQPGADRDALEQALRDTAFGPAAVYDRESSLASVARDPLVAAGGSGILFLASVALLLLVTLALLFNLWVSVQRRRTEFAVLRALGLSRGQVFGVLAFEYATITAVGLGAGIYLGSAVARRMLSFLEVTEDGTHVEPPFVLSTDWLALGASAVVVLAVLAGALVVAVRLMGRTSDATALRLE